MIVLVHNLSPSLPIPERLDSEEFKKRYAFENVTLVEFMYPVFIRICHVRVTVGDPGLCCCICVTYFEL